LKILAGGCRVFSAGDGQITKAGNWTARTVVSAASGAQHINQTVSEYARGRSPAVTNPSAEEVLYVASGEGRCYINGFEYPLRPGTAIFIPPGAIYDIENDGADTLRIVSSCCPDDPDRRIVETVQAAASGDAPMLTVHETEREDIPAGQDRLFRYLIHRDLGCKQITQFAGWIPPSKAPVHYHTYEESIFILEGRGIVHTDDESTEFSAGSSIYFPIGVRHCVENPETSTIKLLGAFYPSGSPGDAYEPGAARD
jgi:mannose-6-phosphate isomerase-like protein (cupin superfamily)